MPLVPARPISNLWKSARLEATEPLVGFERPFENLPSLGVMTKTAKRRSNIATPAEATLPDLANPVRSEPGTASLRQKTPLPRTISDFSPKPEPVTVAGRPLRTRSAELPPGSVVRQEAKRETTTARSAPTAADTSEDVVLEPARIGAHKIKPTGAHHRESATSAMERAAALITVEYTRRSRVAESDNIHLEPASHSEARTPVKGLVPPLEPRTDIKQPASSQDAPTPQNSVHIGTIEVQVVPPPAIRREAPRARGRLARGYQFWSNPRV